MAAIAIVVLSGHSTIKADYTGLNAVVTENVDIDGVLYRSVDLYVGLTDTDDRIWAVISEPDSPLILSAPNGGFYQSSMGLSTPHDTTFDEIFGDMLRYDSYVTIGANSNTPCCTILLGFDEESFNNSDEVIMEDGTWAVLPDNPMAGLGAGDSNGVLIGRFTVRHDQTMSGRLNLLGRLANGDTWSAANVTFSYGPEAVEVPELIGQSKQERYAKTLRLIGDIDGDGVDDFAVGAPLKSTVQQNAGAVYLYSGQTGALIRTLNGQSPNGRYGSSLAYAGDIDGDNIPDLIIGSPRSSHVGDSNGQVDLVSGADGQTILSIYGENEGDRLGTTVAGPPLNSDNPNHPLLLGAPYHDSAGRQSGRIYVLDNLGNQLATIDGSRKGDRFGSSISFIGDTTGDAHSEFIVGSPKNDDNASNAGRADIFSGNSYQMIKTLLGQKAGSRFGSSVVGGGHLDSDIYADFVVAATHYNKSNKQKVGRVYAYSGRHSTMLWKKTGKSTNERLGSFIHITKDINCDGHDDVIISSPRYSETGSSHIGRVVLRSGATAELITSLIGVQPEGFLGESACVVHKSEGTPTLLVGASRMTIDGMDDTGSIVEAILSQCSLRIQSLRNPAAAKFSGSNSTPLSESSMTETMHYYLGDILNLPLDRVNDSAHHRH